MKNSWTSKKKGIGGRERERERERESTTNNTFKV